MLSFSLSVKPFIRFKPESLLKIERKKINFFCKVNSCLKSSNSSAGTTERSLRRLFPSFLSTADTQAVEAALIKQRNVF